MAIVLTNANIYTMNKKFPNANTIVYAGKEIRYVGNNEDNWREVAGKDAKIYNLNGKTIIPGFVDSHCHPGAIARSTWHVRIPYTEDVNEILNYIKEYAEEHPSNEAPFLYVEYYPTHIFGEEGPKKEMLDEIISDRPVVVQDYGEHMSWVNSKMLTLMEVTKDTPDPHPGYRVFVRDENGEPTGFVKEMAWWDFEENLYRNLGWRPPIDITEELVRPVLDFYTKHGVTAIADGFTEDESQIKSIYQLDESCQSKLYYDGAIRCDKLEELEGKINELKKYAEKYSNKHIKFNTMKLFLDGTNESGSGGYLEPIISDDGSENYGATTLNEDELLVYLKRINYEGLDLHVHIVGDRSFHIMCNAYERLINEVGRENVKTQLILAHCELVDPSDMQRPAELGITINYTLRWSGGNYGEKAKIFLGEDRWNRFYTFSPMIKSGALMAFSSDLISFSKMHLSNPFVGMQISHTRVDPDTPLDSKRFPGSVRPPASEKFERGVLLEGYTINSAKQMRWDNIMGSLEVGKLANINIISDNYFEVPEEEIKDIEFLVTIFEGEIVNGNFNSI